MIDLLSRLDTAVFIFLNQTISTPLGDRIWPLITDYDRLLPVRIVLVGVWVLLIAKGGARGRTVALLVIPVLVIADQLSSTVLKSAFLRPRPCHEVGGIPVVPTVHLLVHCGGGMSFPSSHAVNNFAVATVFGAYYRRWAWAFAAWAALVALSRPAVGVHYPSDIIGGALIGFLVAWCVLYLWTAVQQRFLPAWGRQKENMLNDGRDTPPRGTMREAGKSEVDTGSRDLP